MAMRLSVYMLFFGETGKDFKNLEVSKELRHY